MKLVDLDKLSERKYKEVQFNKHGWSNQASMYCEGWNDAIDEIIDNEEVIDAVPVVHGRWEKQKNIFVCSYCRNGYKEQPTIMGEPMFNFCPMCGAKMDGKDCE